MSRANILINAVSAKSGGAATYAVNLARQLANIGSPHRYIFYVPRTLAKSIQGTTDYVAVVETTVGSASSWQRFLWDQVTLRRIVKRERIDVLVSSSDFGIYYAKPKQLLMVRNPLYFSSLYAQTVYPLKSPQFKMEFEVRKKLILLSMRSADLVMTASHSMLTDIKRCYDLPPNKTVVNHFGVPHDRFCPRASHSSKQRRESDNRSFCILYVTEYVDYKNLTTLLKAVRILSDRGVTDFTLVTTADPWQYPEDEMVSRNEDQALALHPRIAPLVRFTGPIPYDDVPQLYQDADLFVYPSLVESFGHPMVEAMASGLPILASDIPICREVCDNAAMYFSPLDPTDLAEKVLLLRYDSRGRQELGEVGRKRAGIHFDWKDHVQRLVEIMEQVAADA